MVKRKRTQRKKKGFFRFGRNPFKLWQSYLVAFFFLFIPIPLGTDPLILNWQCIVLPFTEGGLGNIVANLNSIMGIVLLFSGFFFGASLKKGRDNFFQYGVGLFIIAVILFYLVLNQF